MPRSNTLEGRFEHIVYSPKGEIEGAMLDVDGSPVQLVLDRHDPAAASAVTILRSGQRITVEATPQPPSDKGEAAHAVHDFVRLLSVDGVKFKPSKEAADAGYVGRVVRFNFARHGEPNGVVLDSGHFIHTRPDGMARLKLKIGDKVRAEGDAQFLATGDGWAVEAWTVNGKAVHPE
jgi:hypothetical protein